MWFKIKSFIVFLFQSTNQHGIHSPFVYQLVTKCFYKKTSRSKTNRFHTIQQALFNDTKKIVVTDHGSGSTIFNTNERSVAAIAKIAGIHKKRALLLIRIIEYFKPLNLLEIGTSVGLGSAAMSIANPDATIYTIEGCPTTAKVAQEVFDRFDLKNIHLELGEFDEVLNKELHHKQFDLIYFDGNHQKISTVRYFEQCLTTVHNNSVFIFDDINWSYEMQQAWELIKNHPKVTVTIDTFTWGFVFFRKEQAKQHFTVRI